MAEDATRLIKTPIEKFRHDHSWFVPVTGITVGGTPAKSSGGTINSVTDWTLLPYQTTFTIKKIYERVTEESVSNSTIVDRKYLKRVEISGVLASRDAMTRIHATDLNGKECAFLMRGAYLSRLTPAKNEWWLGYGAFLDFDDYDMKEGKVPFLFSTLHNPIAIPFGSAGAATIPLPVTTETTLTGATVATIVVGGQYITFDVNS